MNYHPAFFTRYLLTPLSLHLEFPPPPILYFFLLTSNVSSPDLVTTSLPFPPWPSLAVPVSSSIHTFQNLPSWFRVRTFSTLHFPIPDQNPHIYPDPRQRATPNVVIGIGRPEAYFTCSHHARPPSSMKWSWDQWRRNIGSIGSVPWISLRRLRAFPLHPFLSYIYLSQPLSPFHFTWLILFTLDPIKSNASDNCIMDIRKPDSFIYVHTSGSFYLIRTTTCLILPNSLGVFMIRG